MKTLTNILDNNNILLEDLILEDCEGNIIVEGFFSKIASFLGMQLKKIINTISNWANSLKTSWTTGQYIAAKSKDQKISEKMKTLNQSLENGENEYIDSLKQLVKKFTNDPKLKEFDENYQMFAYWAYYHLIQLSKSKKDEEGKKIAEDLKKKIDKCDNFKDIKNRFENKYEKPIEKSEVINTIDDKENQKEETTKEIKDETTKVVNDNIDILGELTKKTDIDKETLIKYVTDNLTKSLKKLPDENKKELTEEDILGTCIMICGAFITNDIYKLKSIAGMLHTAARELKKDINKK